MGHRPDNARPVYDDLFDLSPIHQIEMPAGVSDLADWVPATFSEAVAALLSVMPSDVVEMIRKRETVEGSQVTDSLHFSVGMGVRNGFDLWAQNTPLTKEFVDRWRIWHGDDRSAMIFHAVECWIHGKAYDPEPDVRRYHGHWLGYGEWFDGMPPVNWSDGTRS